MTLYRGARLALLNPCVEDEIIQPDVLSDLRLWMKADEGIGFRTGSELQTWTDQSAEGEVFTRISALGPVQDLAVKNGLPMIHWTSNRMDMSIDMASGPYTQAVTCLLIYRANSIEGTLGDPILTNSATLMEFGYDTGGSKAYHSNGSGFQKSTTAADDTNFVMATHVVDGLNSEIRINGVDEVIIGAGAGTNNFARFLLGIGAIAGTVIDGHVGEILFFSRRLTAPEILQMEAYLNSRWDIF